jgi:2-polyprenyl-3-methyl-5-hydroxy-6-metoxy-1,4-benzoquinol methylase
LDKLRFTPLHPQWFAYRHERHRYRIAGLLATGRTLDIGCGRQNLRSYLNRECDYISLDAPVTGEKLYGAQPDVFGHAQNLPFRDRQFDTVILLEVLEHLEQPEIALQDARRLVKAGGTIIVSTPFLYPVHDAPWDFQRWTLYGLQRLAKSAGTTIKELKSLGSTIETGCLIFNLALSWHTLNSPAVARAPLLLLSMLMIPLANLFAATLALAVRDPDNSRFANGYIMVLEIND